MLLEERYKEKYDEGFAEGVAETSRLRIEQLFQNGFSVEDVAKLFDDIPADTIQAIWESFKQSQTINS